MKLTRRLVLAATTLSLASASPSNQEEADEWERYGCGANTLPGQANENAMVACFCGFLQDRVLDPSVELSAAELSTQALETCDGGVARTYPCSNVDLLSHTPLSTFGSVEANDIWGWTSANGQEFALIGLFDGTGFVEITDPVNPIYLGKLPSHTSSSSWRDIKVYNDHAFIVSEASGHGMQVFDLNLLTDLLTSVVSYPVDFANTAHYGAVGNAHNIVINEDSGFAYIVGGSNDCSGGLHMVDISTPTAPTTAGCYGGDGYTHDAHCVIYDGPDVIHQGKEICFACNEDTITVVDVTNKSNPIQISRATYADEGYTHQGWLSPDHRYFVFGDETDERSFGFNTKTLVFDVQDLENTFLTGTYFGPTAAIDHNLYIQDDIIYLSNYRAGLRVLRVNDYATADFVEIGFFDIYPSSDSNSFNGAWSAFPYFPSGNVVISGIEQGLFVVRPVLGPVTAGPTASSTLNPTCVVAASCRTNGDCCDGNGYICEGYLPAITNGPPRNRRDEVLGTCATTSPTDAPAPTVGPAPTDAPAPTDPPANCIADGDPCKVDGGGDSCCESLICDGTLRNGRNNGRCTSVSSIVL